MNLDGILFRFIDTAGIRETSETIERIGIERTLKKLNEADIVLGLIDATQAPEAIQQAAQAIVEKVDQSHQSLLLLLNKTDLRRGASLKDVLPISAKTGEGIDLFANWLLSEVREWKA